MRFYLLMFSILILCSSCLKRSIPDAMLNADGEGKKKGNATLSYELNGDPVKITVEDPNNQNPGFYTLGCTKSGTFYTLAGLSGSGEISFLFLTDSLTAGEYTYTGVYGEKFFISYYGENEFVYNATDYMTFIVTSHEKGYISGNFSGQLTPLIASSSFGDTFGDPGSVKVTNGVFKNIPVFY